MQPRVRLRKLTHNSSAIRHASKMKEERLLMG